MQSLTDEWKNGNPTGMTIPAIYLINRPADGERFVPAELGIWPQLWSYDKISIVVEFVLIPFRTLAFCRLSLVLSVFEKRAFDRCFQSLRGTARHWDAEPITIRFLSNRHTVFCVCVNLCVLSISFDDFSTCEHFTASWKMISWLEEIYFDVDCFSTMGLVDDLFCCCC